MIKVLVADSQALFAEAVGGALGGGSDIEVVPEYPTRGGTALEAAQRHRPDVVIYDHWMLGVNGPAAAAALASSLPGAKVLVLSWYHGPLQIRAALKAGAVGFLPKSLGLEQLTEAVHRAAAGEPLVFGVELARLIDGIDERYAAAVVNWERFSTLTPREVEVLRALADAPPSGVAVALGISAGTVKNHLHHIFAKTETTTQLEAIRVAREAGVIPEPAGTRPANAAPADAPASGVATRDGRTTRTSAASSSPSAGGNTTCSVLVADTERLFAEALGRCLSREPDLSVINGYPTTGLAAVGGVLRHRPDVVLYDLWLRGLQATAGVQALQRWAPATKAVMLSWFHGRPQVRRALASGVGGIVPKSGALADVVDTVRAAHARAPEDHATDLLRLVGILRQGEVAQGEGLERLLSLTPRELQLLQFLAAGWPAKRIATEICLAYGSVKNGVHRILTKTGAQNQAEAVALARRHGFLDPN